jgi:hypothetical protein
MAVSLFVRYIGNWLPISSEESYWLCTCLTLRLLMSYIYGAPSKARNLKSYIYGRDFLLRILLLEQCISLIYAWKTNKYTNFSFNLLIMYGSSYMFRHCIASSGSVPSAFWEMLNWEAVDRILWMGVLCLVTWCACAPRHQQEAHFSLWWFNPIKLSSPFYTICIISLVVGGTRLLIYRVIKKSLCTWWLQYKNMKKYFKQFQSRTMIT